MREKIIENYMNYVLENNEEPRSVFVFAKSMQMQEGEFYKYFSSFGSLKRDVFEEFFKNALVLLKKDNSFESFDGKDKLLAFYYTFFEVLLVNRSYVVYALGGETCGLANMRPWNMIEKMGSRLSKLSMLGSLKKCFKDFFKELDLVSVPLLENGESKPLSKLNELKDCTISDLAWWQFVGVIEFWLQDTSSGFEKTDVLIEKSVVTGVELMNTKPVESLMDLGKFVFKEMKPK